MKYLHGHISEETAKVVEDYPWGFRLRTQQRYWIESVAGRGDRFVTQTKNPKTGLWCNPKKSTYNAVQVMVERDNGHIGFICFSTGWDNEKAVKAFVEKIGGIDKLNAVQSYKVKEAIAISKTQEHVTCEIKQGGTVNVTKLMNRDPEERAKANKIEQEQEKNKKEQEKVEKTLGKAFNYYMIK